jgi:hypothetical protein
MTIAKTWHRCCHRGRCVTVSEGDLLSGKATSCGRCRRSKNEPGDIGPEHGWRAEVVVDDVKMGDLLIRDFVATRAEANSRPMATVNNWPRRGS